jgi:hypothetical protein
LVVSALAPVCSAQSSRWTEVGGSDQITAYADTQSLRRQGPKVKVWLKWINAAPADTDTVYPKKKYMSAKALSVYHCADRTAVTLQVIRYADADGGEVVETLNVSDKPENYSELAPETIGESILNYVCKASPPSKK